MWNFKHSKQIGPGACSIGKALIVVYQVLTLAAYAFSNSKWDRLCSGTCPGHSKKQVATCSYVTTCFCLMEIGVLLA